MTIIDALEAAGRVFDTQAKTLRDVLNIAYDVKRARACRYDWSEDHVSGLIGAKAAYAIARELHAKYFSTEYRPSARMDLICVEQLRLLLHNGCFGCGDYAIVLVDFRDIDVMYPECHAIIRYPTVANPKLADVIDIPDVEWKVK